VSRVRKGDRFVTTRDVATSGLTTWLAPFTGDFPTDIPEGTVLVADHDAVATAPGFSCLPDRYDEMEAALVPEEDRRNPKYAGYYFVFLDSDIGDTLRQL
jgi:hypothetical protein